MKAVARACVVEIGSVRFDRIDASVAMVVGGDALLSTSSMRYREDRGGLGRG